MKKPPIAEMNTRINATTRGTRAMNGHVFVSEKLQHNNCSRLEMQKNVLQKQKEKGKRMKAEV
jgi:hypothetical protein